MWINRSIFLAALFAGGCAAPKLAPLSAEHPAYAGLTSAPLAQPGILSTYRPAIDTRAAPNTFPSPAGKSVPQAGSIVDHAAMGHGMVQRPQEAGTSSGSGAPPVDHAAMGHGDAKTAASESPKPAIPAKQTPSKGGHDGH